MSAIAVHNGAWVLVGDGRRALFFSNHGDAELLDLRVVETRVEDNPPTREQGSDAPGRAFSSVSPGRSAMGNVDWHELEEERFARAMAERINVAAESGEMKEIVIVAPPRTLGEIRKELSVKAQSKVAGELHKDLTRHPVPEIEKMLALKPAG
ncbi:MAG: host cell attachment protein [Methylocystis sp.]|nr:MAG: host cell attachment protein [Methylocystis sp.]